MADLVTITIDGQKTTVPKGALVIEAATQLGIDVPRFCYHPKLSAVGMCRMCLAEVGMPKLNPDRTPATNPDGTPQVAMMPKPQTLCTTQAADGMVIFTETEDVKKMQHGVLEFFLANHPLDCPVCDKGGECMLQDQSMAYASGESRVQDLYQYRKDLAKDYPLSDLISLDQERCIQCARCTRFCDEIAQDHVLDFFERGSKTLIGTHSDPPFDSKFSGNTIDICPVGALTSRDFRFRARVWELKNVPTISMADGCGTNIFVSQRNETMVRVIPRDNEAINECWISDRDRFGFGYVDHADRLTQPLVRRPAPGGSSTLEPATWDEALQIVVDKLQEVKEQHGASAIGAVGGPKLTNEGALAMASFFRDIVGTPNLAHSWTPQSVTPGKPGPALYEELESADVIMVVGANPNEELPILDLRLKKAAFQHKVQIINVNPYKTPLDRLATQSLIHNYGSESALINGLSRMVHQSWADEPTKTELLHRVETQAGARPWLDSLAPYAANKVVELAGVDEEMLRAVSAAIATSERLFLLVGESVTPATFSALQNLAALKGRSDYLVVLHPEPNTVGVRRAGLNPGEKGMDGPAMLKTAAEGGLRALYLTATNPLHSAADGELAWQAVAQTDFVVIQTLFENELCHLADVVLPAATFMEQDGSATNFHGKVQVIKQVFRPRERRNDKGDTLSACAPDWAIFTRLAQLMGADWTHTKAGDWMERFKTLPSAGPAEPRFEVVAESEGMAPEEGKLVLLTGNLLYDGGESFIRNDRLNRVVPEPYVCINRKDARRLGIEHGALVEVISSRGTAAVLARVGRQVREGNVWMPRRLRQVQVNLLTEPGSAPTYVTLTKLADAPPPPAETAVVSGAEEGATPDPALTTAVAP